MAEGLGSTTYNDKNLSPLNKSVKRPPQCSARSGRSFLNELPMTTLNSRSINTTLPELTTINSTAKRRQITKPTTSKSRPLSGIKAPVTRSSLSSNHASDHPVSVNSTKADPIKLVIEESRRSREREAMNFSSAKSEWALEKQTLIDDNRRLTSDLRSLMMELQGKQSEYTDKFQTFQKELQSSHLERLAAKEECAVKLNTQYAELSERKELELQKLRENLEQIHEEKIKSIQKEHQLQLKASLVSHEEKLKTELDKEILVKETSHQRSVEKVRLDYDAQLDTLRKESQDLTQQLLYWKDCSGDLEQTWSAKLKQADLDHKNAVSELEQQLSKLKSEHAKLVDSYDQEVASRKKLEDKFSNTLHSENELLLKFDTLNTNSEQWQKQRDAARAEAALYKQRLIKEETLRRKLHNQVQELKGNIRVYCRVRPALPHEKEQEIASITYPDEESLGQEITVKTANNDTQHFTFDKVFDSHSTNSQVYEEISQLVQSAIDGHNVCIFAYGQTGSGKTYTMSSSDGMIPRTIDQIFKSVESLKDSGWSYELQGQFLEIYNESVVDLLAGTSTASDDTCHKLDIRHDPLKQQNCIPELTSVFLDQPSRVATLLKKASRSRSVGATKCNEWSSRSHSIFVLSISGHNVKTNAKCHSVLNLVDLAGSERVSESQVTGERLRETQNINRSLSCLGDVIYALSTGKPHVPYRNSKLTYLLQYSLSGSSKTLMLVNVSPLTSQANETVNSLRFAHKVNNTQLTRRKPSPSLN